jgi:hypothetical protein
LLLLTDSQLGKRLPVTRFTSSKRLEIPAQIINCSPAGTRHTPADHRLHDRMPVYFIHGFRWPRALIRIHIILHNLEDSAAEWLVAPGTTREMLDNFNQLYPESMEHLKHLRFVEQYDPNDTTAGSGSQPYAYVADVVEEVKLGVDVDEIRGKGVPNDQWASIMELRDQLAPEEKVAWYIVVCGDEERWAPPASGEEVPYEEPAQAIPLREREPERVTALPNPVEVGV